jgi:hypothetical protein
MNTPLRQALLITLCAALGACASSRGELDTLLDEQIGKPMDDPSTFRVQQEKNRINTSRGPHGHVQEEYAVGFRQGCRVLLEVDPQQRKIVNWRYGVSQTGDADCYMSPNVGR